MAQKKTPLPRLKSLPKNVSSKSVADLKKKYHNIPLHFLFGVEKEIDYQCPILDEYLEQLKDISDTLSKIRRCKSVASAQSHAALGLYKIAEMSNGIDEVTRGNFEKLRSTAEAWKQLAIQAMNETKNPEKFIKI